MEHKTDLIYTEGNITLLNRLIRAAVALAMLGSAMYSPANPLDIVALLPLIAIYPMFTAVVGWDPVQFIINTAQSQGRRARVRLAARILLAGISAAMISATLMVSGELGWYSLLALAAIVPMFLAILGEDPIEALCESSEHWRQVDETQREQPVNTVDNRAMDENADSRESLPPRKAA
jgi:hypothetical protein